MHVDYIHHYGFESRGDGGAHHLLGHSKDELAVLAKDLGHLEEVLLADFGVGTGIGGFDFQADIAGFVAGEPFESGFGFINGFRG
jgi:hypothetical protein